LARSRTFYRVTGVVLGFAISYCVFYLLPQSFVLFTPFLGVSTPMGGVSALGKLQDLLVPAVAIGVAYPLALRTRYQGAMATVLGFALAVFLLYAFQGGTMDITTLQSTSTGLQVSVDTSLSFAPLLYLSLVPIAAFIAKSCYLSYVDMKEAGFVPPSPIEPTPEVSSK
jgi:hypothetical protein